MEPTTQEKMNRLAEDLSEVETAAVAAEILSSCDPTKTNLEAFIEDLGDEFKEALYNHLHTDLGK